MRKGAVSNTDKAVLRVVHLHDGCNRDVDGDRYCRVYARRAMKDSKLKVFLNGAAWATGAAIVVFFVLLGVDYLVTWFRT